MIQVVPLTLDFNGVRLEPLSMAHANGLRAAACDGELWRLRITSVPEPDQVGQYIAAALSTSNRLAFAVVGLRTDNFNFASQTAIERLGAKKDGVLRHHHRRRDGTVRDTVMYSIMRGEWPEIKSHLHYKLQRT